MKHTNKTNLPEALFQSLSQDPYKKVGNFTASELPTPTQIWVLRKRYRDKIIVDVSDLIYPLIGNNTHYILERAGVKNALTEERLFATVGLWFVSGKLDFYYADRTLWDYKVTSMWVLIDGVKPDWEAQCNINALLLHENGFSTENIKICCIFRDWSKVQALTNPNYLSKKQVSVLGVTMWGVDNTREYILSRIKAFTEAEDLPDNELPKCTPEERWQRPDKYAITRLGNKKASKLCESEEEAQEWIGKANPKMKYEITFRPGESVRCKYYCEVKDFCQQYNKED